MNNIVTINTAEQFKDNAISLSIPLPLNDKITEYNLITQILKRGCKKYKSTKETFEKLQDMYGAVFDIVTAKKGEMLLVTFYIQVIDNKYAFEKEDIFSEAVELLNEYVNNPLIINGEFNNEYFEKEKNNLRDLIESRIDDKDEYAIDRAMEICSEGEPYEIFRFGNVESLNKIENNALVKLWEETLKSCQMYFYVCGNISNSICESTINKYFKVNVNSCQIDMPVSGVNKPLKEVVEQMKVNQGKLAMCFKTKESVVKGGYNNLAVMNSILGGGVHSKLFIEVREKNSLAYYCYSFVEKYKGLLVIAAGIDSKSYEKTKDIIFKQIEEIKGGNISEVEFNSSKNKLISDFRKIKDSQYSIMDYLVSLHVYGINMNLDETIESIRKVEIEAVMEAAKGLIPGAIYFMKGENVIDTQEN